MDLDQALTLYDSFWFHLNVCQDGSSTTKSLVSSLHHPDRQPGGESGVEEPVATPTHRRCTSEEPMNLTEATLRHRSLSPQRSPISPGLQTILSGKQVADDEGNKPSFGDQKPVSARQRNKGIGGKTRRKEKHRSLSELEFQELKGFMDLGFIFTEEDKNSELSEIVPGLQRMPNSGEGHYRRMEFDEAGVQRPYLSEAWDCSKRRTSGTPFLDFRIPASNNEFDIKDQLRWWAHTVASNVR